MSADICELIVDSRDPEKILQLGLLAGLQKRDSSRIGFVNALLYYLEMVLYLFLFGINSAEILIFEI